MHVISGTVTDATTGWPLYAHITVAGNPANPPAPADDFWTDPVTGFYSVTLAEGITYTFDVAAWVTGYLPASRDVVVTSNGTQNFALGADLVACNAPGYSISGGLTENFDSVTTPALPAGWAKVVVTSTTTAASWDTIVEPAIPLDISSQRPQPGLLQLFQC